jgi:TonB-dependent starch-binding outer membrane protein SusC
MQYTRQWGRNYLFNEALLAGAPGGFRAGSDIYGNLPVARTDYWTIPGDQTEFQRLYPLAYHTPIETLYLKAADSDLAWVDASYFKLRNISVSWLVPQEWSKAIGIVNCTFFASGQNLLTFTNYEGLDPEVQQAGITPLLKTYTAGIRLGL